MSPLRGGSVAEGELYWTRWDECLGWGQTMATYGGAMVRSNFVVRVGLLLWPVTPAAVLLSLVTETIPDSSLWSVILASFVFAVAIAFASDSEKKRGFIAYAARLGGVTVAVWLALTVLKVLGNEPVGETLPILLAALFLLTLAVVLDMRKTMKQQKTLEKLPFNYLRPEEQPASDFNSAREFANRVTISPPAAPDSRNS